MTLENGIFIYAILLYALYCILSLLSAAKIKRFRRKNRNEDFRLLQNKKAAPFVSVIAPAFNEEKTILVNVRSLLELNYPNFEIVVVNDGSGDRSLELLIREFDLVRTDYCYIQKIKTRSFRSVYKSVNPKYARLTVADKANTGSKADALNVGINVSSHDYILCIDVDCVIERDVLLKMMKAMISSKARTVGVGAAIRISNNCDVDTATGRVEQSNLPVCLLGLFQELEYMRSFLISKMGWGLINSVPNISGALGLFEKEVVIEAGGYDAGVIAEDMDLVVKIASYMLEKGEEYEIPYIPVWGSWTEAPTTVSQLVRQRVRWSTGLIQVLANHRKKMFNAKYKRVGWVILPYNLLFEVFAPILEITGFTVFLILLLSGHANGHLLVLIFLFSISFGWIFASAALMFDSRTGGGERSWKENSKLMMLVFLEPLFYHPILVFSSLKGFFNYFNKRKIKWGSMVRKGYCEEPQTLIAQPDNASL